jgi:hydroxymethyl cephem carbamoyltransferase
MRILAFKPGHDGAAAYLEDEHLVFCIEAEKDSYLRYDPLNPETFLASMSRLSGTPDIVAVGGWRRALWEGDLACGSGYRGHEQDTNHVTRSTFVGQPVTWFSSTHERSHLLCSYGLSPYPQGKRCYALIWEGHIGAFYEIDERVQITKIGDVLSDVGIRYLYLYHLAKCDGQIDFGAAGKLMALAAYGHLTSLSEDEKAILDYVINASGLRLSDAAAQFDTPFLGIGVESQLFKDLARKFSNRLFDIYHNFATKNLKQGYPLLIGGGCGLNCEWNSAWADCGLFEDVFVPPCCNDSGSAVGTAIDAQFHQTGSAKISWSVYCGEEFIIDAAPSEKLWHKHYACPDEIAKRLLQGEIIGWIQGRYEMGPRALGHRSILAEPFAKNTRSKLNIIKQRESYRPVSPMCLDSEVKLFFQGLAHSPYMLYFYKVLDRRLQAITHVDGSARVQTVNAEQEEETGRLLDAFKRLSSVPILCNTSLNFTGRGFINRMSHLIEFAETSGLDGFVVGKNLYVLRRN